MKWEVLLWKEKVCFTIDYFFFMGGHHGLCFLTATATATTLCFFVTTKNCILLLLSSAVILLHIICIHGCTLSPFIIACTDQTVRLGYVCTYTSQDSKAGFRQIQLVISLNIIIL